MEPPSVRKPWWDLALHWGLFAAMLVMLANTYADEWVNDWVSGGMAFLCVIVYAWLGILKLIAALKRRNNGTRP